MKKEVKRTGIYAIVSYGEDGKSDLPLFLEKENYSRLGFTANIDKARFFDYVTAAERTHSQVLSRVKDMGIGYKHIKVVELFAAEIPPLTQ